MPTAYKELRKSINAPAITRIANEFKKLYEKLKTNL